MGQSPGCVHVFTWGPQENQATSDSEAKASTALIRVFMLSPPVKSER